MNLSSVVEGGHALLKRGRTGSRIELQVGHAALTRHAVNHGSSHAARAIGEPAVIVFGIPEVDDRDND